MKLDNILLHFPGQDNTKPVGNDFLRNWDPSTDEVIVVIGDLGFAKKIDKLEMLDSYCGTPLNMAPQILFGQCYDDKADVWSLGTMIYEMLVGFPPFTGVDANNLAQNIKKGNFALPKNIKMSMPCFYFISAVLKLEPEKRITHEDMLTHQFF